MHTAPVPADGTPCDYLLAGLVFCGICGRLTDSHWVHDRAGYHNRTIIAFGVETMCPRIDTREKHTVIAAKEIPISRVA